MALTEPIKRGLEIDHIEVKVPPDKLLYHEDELIDLTGIKVIAYYTDGSPFGLVPVEELVPVPNPVEFIWSGAEYSTPSGPIVVNNKEFHGPFYVKRISRLLRRNVRVGSNTHTTAVPEPPLEDPIQYAFAIHARNSARDAYIKTDDQIDNKQKFLVVADSYGTLICSNIRFETTFNGFAPEQDENGFWNYRVWGMVPSIQHFTHNDKTVYFYYGFLHETYLPVVPISSQFIRDVQNEVAWYLWYGADAIKPWPQWETVEWTHSVTGRTFKAGYEISVIVNS